MAHDTFADHIPRRRGQLVLEVVPPLVSLWNIHLTLRIIDNNPFLGPFSLMPGLAIRARWLDDKPAGTQHPKLIRMGEALRKYGWYLVALSRSGMHQHSPWSKRDMAGSRLPRLFPSKVKHQSPSPSWYHNSYLCASTSKKLVATCHPEKCPGGLTGASTALSDYGYLSLSPR